MTHRFRRPWLSLVVTGLVAGLLALPGQPGAAQQEDTAAGATATHVQLPQKAGKQVISLRELEFRNEMRKLWEDHVVWTRMAIVSFADDLPDFGFAAERLLRNQDDIGDAIAPFYGQEAADELAALLREHILIAVDVLAAAKAGDQPGLEDAQARWEANAEDIAAFLAAANPDNWPFTEMRQMMLHHLALTTQEAVARLTGDYEADVAAYDAVHDQILHMADMLSDGVVDQFPGHFRPGRG